MAARTPAEAVTAYLEPIQRSVLCVSTTVAGVRGGYAPRAQPHFLGAGIAEPLRLRGSDLRVSVTQHYRIVEEGSREWDVVVVAYEYLLLMADAATEVLAYHWHPGGANRVTHPHLHPGPAMRRAIDARRPLHLPTGPVSVQEFIWMLISDFGARPLRDDWREVLRGGRQASA